MFALAEYLLQELIIMIMCDFCDGIRRVSRGFDFVEKGWLVESANRTNARLSRIGTCSFEDHLGVRMDGYLLKVNSGS